MKRTRPHTSTLTPNLTQPQNPLGLFSLLPFDVLQGPLFSALDSMSLVPLMHTCKLFACFGKETLKINRHLRHPKFWFGNHVASSGYLNLFKWFLTQPQYWSPYNVNWKTCSIAESSCRFHNEWITGYLGTKATHLPILQWVATNKCWDNYLIGAPPKWDIWTCIHAARNGHLAILEFMKSTVPQHQDSNVSLPWNNYVTEA